MVSNGIATPAGRGPAAVEQRLAMGEAFFKRLIDEDTPIMSSIRFREGVMPRSRPRAVEVPEVRTKLPQGSTASKPHGVLI
jgi:hypothetical protein